jgi:hypothetical protein
LLSFAPGGYSPARSHCSFVLRQQLCDLVPAASSIRHISANSLRTAADSLYRRRVRKTSQSTDFFFCFPRLVLLASPGA